MSTVAVLTTYKEPMRTEELLESCLQALSSGQELPPDIARYLARHPERRAEVEELILVAQRASRLAPVELSTSRRERMQERLAARIGVQPELFSPGGATLPTDIQQDQQEQGATGRRTRRKPLLAAGWASLARLRHWSPTPADEVADARIRTAFSDLTPEDIRRYIGVRGEEYLYYRQRFPQWEVIFALLAFVLRSFKRLEKITNLY